MNDRILRHSLKIARDLFSARTAALKDSVMIIRAQLLVRSAHIVGHCGHGVLAEHLTVHSLLEPFPGCIIDPIRAAVIRSDQAGYAADSHHKQEQRGNELCPPLIS